MEGAAAETETESGAVPAGAFVLFTVAGLMLSAGLVLFAPLVPGELRKLLLFPAGVAAVAGWFLASGAAAAGLSQAFRRRPGLNGLVVLLMVLTLGGVQVRAWSLWQAAHPSSVETDRIHQLTREVAGSEAVPADMREHFAQAFGQSREQISFSAWLRHRVSRLGDWSTTAAALFFFVEICLASMLGLWIFRRQLPAGSSPRKTPLAAGSQDA
ncbi:MAG: hypothetical protein KDA79_21075 [Planctomycetaceae bacterium]|nr:hypothetical protein [Planctomycetaceae bacterium]